MSVAQEAVERRPRIILAAGESARVREDWKRRISLIIRGDVVAVYDQGKLPKGAPPEAEYVVVITDSSGHNIEDVFKKRLPGAKIIRVSRKWAAAVSSLENVGFKADPQVVQASVRGSTLIRLWQAHSREGARRDFGSPTIVQVGQLREQGRSYAQIAQELGISPTHARRLHKKFLRQPGVGQVVTPEQTIVAGSSCSESVFGLKRKSVGKPGGVDWASISIAWNAGCPKNWPGMREFIRELAEVFKDDGGLSFDDVLVLRHAPLLNPVCFSASSGSLNTSYWAVIRSRNDLPVPKPGRIVQSPLDVMREARKLLPEGVALPRCNPYMEDRRTFLSLWAREFCQGGKNPLKEKVLCTAEVDTYSKFVPGWDSSLDLRELRALLCLYSKEKGFSDLASIQDVRAAYDRAMAGWEVGEIPVSFVEYVFPTAFEGAFGVSAASSYEDNEVLPEVSLSEVLPEPAPEEIVPVVKRFRVADLGVGGVVPSVVERFVGSLVEALPRLTYSDVAYLRRHEELWPLTGASAAAVRKAWAAQAAEPVLVSAAAYNVRGHEDRVLLEAAYALMERAEEHEISETWRLQVSARRTLGDDLKIACVCPTVRWWEQCGYLVEQYNCPLTFDDVVEAYAFAEGRQEWPEGVPASWLKPLELKPLKAVSLLKAESEVLALKAEVERLQKMVLKSARPGYQQVVERESAGEAFRSSTVRLVNRLQELMRAHSVTLLRIPLEGKVVFTQEWVTRDVFEVELDFNDE